MSTDVYSMIHSSVLMPSGLLILLTILSTNVFGHNSMSNTSDRYVIEFNAANPKLVRVKANIELEDSLLYMSPYGPVPDRWPTFISGLVATSVSGDEISLELLDSVAWTIEQKYVGQPITIQYVVQIEHESQDWPGGIDGVAFVRDWGVMASGRSLFIMNGDSLKVDIQVEFELPDNWNLTAPWKKIDPVSETYSVPNLLQLQESLLFAGTHKEVQIKRDGFNLKFAMGGHSISENEHEYVERAGAVLDYYIKTMGGIPKPAPGNDISQVVVIINESAQIDGEVIGNHISLLMDPSADPQGQIIGWFMFAHEFFHLWNGKSLRFQGTESDWFKEGVSNYYTLKALHNAEFISEEDIKSILNNLFYARYTNDPGFGKLAPSEAASGFDKDNHWGLIYGGGMFAGMCMDMEIRHNSNNERSLDDAMRHFYDQYAGTQKSISNADILEQINTLAISDLSNFMDSCIKGINPVPIADYFHYAGITIDTTNGELSLKHDQDKSELEKYIWSGFLGVN